MLRFMYNIHKNVTSMTSIKAPCYFSEKYQFYLKIVKKAQSIYSCYLPLRSLCTQYLHLNSVK